MVLVVSENIFNSYIEKPTVFKNKKTLTSSFIPMKILHRNEEINQISSILAPALRGYQPNNVFIYGTCGTGKTVVTRFVFSQLKEATKNKSIKTIYINCKMKKVADTEYRLLAQLIKELGETVPDTGLPTDVLYRKFFEKIDEKKQTVIIALDEIDSLFRKVGDEFLYNLTRINPELKQSQITTVGITNDLSFREALDQRVKSSLSEEEIIFKPYDAMQLKDILTQRIKQGFNESVVNENVINKCAALAAQEHGDARRALDLLRVAGEIAERSGNPSINENHVDQAEEKIDLDRITETVKTQPKHSQAVLHAIIKLTNNGNNGNNGSNGKWIDARLLTGDVFSSYQEICSKNSIKALTQRRVSDLISELDMLGIITAKVISKGRYGRTREISLPMNDNALDNVKNFLTNRFN